MKKVILLAVIILLCNSIQSNSQYVPAYITVQSGATTTSYTDLNLALTLAPAGSTVYIPTGEFTLNSSLRIDRKLNIVGSGHYSTNSFGLPKTIINGGLLLVSGADSSLITGIYFSLGIGFTSTNGSSDSLNNVRITRCNIASIGLGNTVAPFSRNIQISENIIRTQYGNSIDGGNALNCIIEKNIILGNIQNIYSSIINNNVFLLNQPFGGIYNSLFRNNIFKEQTSNSISSGVVNSNFSNNFFPKVTITDWSNNTQQNNIMNPTPTIEMPVFVNQSGTTFNYAHDYHLAETSLGNNAGTDGTDVGIYGTALPYKENALPYNPKITGFSIIVNGTNLQLNASAQAQPR